MDLLDNGMSSSLVGPALVSDKRAGALSVEHLRRVVIDASHVDQKKRGVMDSGDTMIPLARWLSRKEFKERYADPESPVDLMFY